MGFLLSVEYPDDMYPAGDDRLERILGLSASSGIGFGSRDLQWNYKTERGAKAAAKRIKRIVERLGGTTAIEEEV